MAPTETRKAAYKTGFYLNWNIYTSALVAHKLGTQTPELTPVRLRRVLRVAGRWSFIWKFRVLS